MIQTEGAKAAQEFNFQKSMRDFDNKAVQNSLKSKDIDEKVRSNVADEGIKREALRQKDRSDDKDRALKSKQINKQTSKNKDK